MDTSFGSDSGSSMPSSISYPSSGSDSGYFSMSPNRTYTVSGSDLSADSFRRPQGPISPRGPIPTGDALCAPPARAPARAPLPSPPPPAGPSAFLFQPQGASTPRGPPPDGHWGGPRYRTYTVSDPGSSMPSSISYSSSGSDSGYFSMSPSRSHTVSGSDSVYFSMSPNAGTPGQVLSG
ncbi:proline-rich proteoglycan 2-like [Passer domesticus]|uniref:proline-rich proteoglycan 2-like n=1 Tax=Passer domesticus TaxID=48849 RepID=UPI0030FF342D